MICMEEVGAMVKEIWKKVIWPVMAVLFLAVVFRPLCMAEGGIDYWKLLFLMGIPFGVQKMFVWLIPSGYGIGETSPFASVKTASSKRHTSMKLPIIE